MGNPPVKTTIEGAIARIVGRDLSADERQMLVTLRDDYGYDDTDPIVPFLSMLGAHMVLTKDIPEKIMTASQKIIETHAVVLREQSMVVAKDLVGNLVGIIHTADRTRKDRWIDGLVGAVVGVAISAIGFYFLRH